MPDEPANPTSSGFAETMVSNDSQFSKEQQDIALAALLLRTGTLTERQLATALATWTIHGSKPLATHLVERKLIGQQACAQLQQQAARELRSKQQTIDERAANGRGSVVLQTLEEVDGTGTIARLLGIRGAAGASVGDASATRGTTVRYRLIRKIGQGGLGRVWLAFDESMKRYVAIKEIVAAADPTALERFRREAEITGRLEHPGIVPVYELGEDADTGEWFYAMRFLGKRSLHDAIMEYHERRAAGDDDPMLIRELLTAFVSVCQAIGHAHSRKVIHRDLKPENVAIDSFGQVIVIDWGLAKVIDEAGGADMIADPFAGDISDQQSTIEGRVLGTPLYMAPEQAAGRVDELDERTDIYGLGAVLYAILTGSAPHEHTRASSASGTARDLISAIAGGPTPRAKSQNPDVDPALDAICAKAMAKRQYARYESASHLAEDVQRWMAGEQVSAYQESPAQRVARWISHHRIWSQVIAGVFIVAVVTLATLAIAARQNYMAQREMSFYEMRDDAREIEMQLQDVAADLSKDARFMSTLPPIQAIVAARADGAANEGDSEEVWRGRLETIYEGLLKANPDYLAIAYAAVGDDAQGGGQEIVRVERFTTDAAYVRSVPGSRLGEVEPPELAADTAALPPGEIMLTLGQSSGSGPTARSAARLIATVPVYDDSAGGIFGLVAIETNLQQQLMQMLENLAGREAEVFITDDSGQVLITFSPDAGVVLPSQPTNVADIIPATSEYFTGSQRQPLLDRAHGCVAQRVQLDPAHPQATVGIVFRLVK